MKKFTLKLATYLTLIVFTISIFSFLGIVAFANQEIKFPSVITENEKRQFLNHDPTMKLQLLFNIDNKPEYILAYHNDHPGYEIYSRISGQLLEASKVDPSPFLNIKKGYYLSPLNYGEYSNSTLFEVKTGYKYSKVEKNKISNKQKTLKDTALKQRKSATSTNLDLNNTTYNFNVMQIEEDYTIVSHPELFYLWDDSLDFGLNTSGSCEAVALTLLLKYADYLNGGVIPGLPPQTWSNATNGKTVLAATDNNANTQGTYDLTMTNLSNPNYTIENLHKYLIHLSGATALGIGSTQKITALNTYASEVMGLGCLNINLLSANQESIIKTYEIVRGRILNYDMPSQISIFSAKGNGNTEYHSVVAYGVSNPYPTTNYYFSIHTGWSSPSNCIINGDYIDIDNRQSVSLSVTQNSTHTLSQNANNTIHNCLNANCYANGVAHRYYNNLTDDYHSCSCGNTASHNKTIVNAENYDVAKLHYCNGCGAYEEHAWVANENYSSFHQCNGCSYALPHDYFNMNDRHICSTCAKTELCSYSYSYCDNDGNVLSSQHRAICSVCNNEVLKDHAYDSCVDKGLSGHSLACSTCGLTLEATAHTYIYVYFDSTYHRTECSACGRTSIKTKHNYEPYLGVLQKCKGCGHTKI